MKKLLLLSLLVLFSSCEKEDNSALIDSYESQISLLNSQLSQLNSQVVLLNADLAITRSEINSLQNLINTIPGLESTIDDLNSKIIEYQNQIDTLENEISVLSNTVIVQTQTETILVSNNDEYVNEINNLRSQISALEAQIHIDIFTLCPYIDSDNIGTWSATLTWPSYFNEPYHQGFPKTVTSSSSDGLLVFNDVFGVGKDLTITIDLDKSQSVTAGTDILEPSMAYFAGYTNPYLTQRSNTYLFSCSGEYKITLKQCVDQGCFGSGSDTYITLTKQ
jgi:prefoldin subunit 5